MCFLFTNKSNNIHKRIFMANNNYEEANWDNMSLTELQIIKNDIRDKIYRLEDEIDTLKGQLGKLDEKIKELENAYD